MNKPIRILQVGMSPNYGGTEAFVMTYYRKIDRTKVQFDFLNVYNVDIACQNEIIELGGIIYYVDMSRRSGYLKYIRRLEDFFKRNSKNFDVIHCNMQSLINIDILKYAKKYNIPMRIAHAHNTGYGKTPTIVQKFFIKNNMRAIKHCATHFFACSKMAAEWMFPNNIDCTVINNAIDTKKFIFSQEIRDKKRKELNISGDTKTIIFVGRLDPQKNPFFLIDIFDKIVKINYKAKLLIVGDGYLKQDIEKVIYKKKLNSNIKILGFRSDVDELLQAADAFILPSFFEGLGIVLIEAQASGLPCFASEFVIPKSVNITGLVDFIPLKESAEVWANHILNKMSMHKVRKNMYSIVCNKNYDIDTNIKILEKMYLESQEEKI